MNPVDFSIDYIINGVSDISPYLLKLAFDNPNNGYGQQGWGIQSNTDYTIEQGIREKVIAKMVAPLLNVTGGITTVLDLSGATVRNLQGGNIHVSVPDFLTGGRKILSVVEVYPGNINRAIASGFNFTAPAGCGTGGQMGNAMNRAITGLDDGNVQRIYTTFQMVGNNSFVILEAGAMMFNLLAKVILSYDEHFSVIPPRMYEHFAELVELATKAFIFKNCRRGMQEAVNRYGVSIDEVRDDVERYADAGREFKEYFNETIKKRLAYADVKGKADSIKISVPRKR